MSTVILGPSTVMVDGVDLSGAASRYVLEARAHGGVPTLLLDLHLEVLGRYDGPADVIIPASTRAALVALGWTPPEE